MKKQGETKSIGQIYVVGIFGEHSDEIFPVYCKKILNEIPGNIPK